MKWLFEKFDWRKTVAISFLLNNPNEFFSGFDFFVEFWTEEIVRIEIPEKSKHFTSMKEFYVSRISLMKLVEGSVIASRLMCANGNWTAFAIHFRIHEIDKILTKKTVID